MELSSLQNSLGKFTIAAFDHRSSLGSMLGIDLTSDDGGVQFTQLKQLFMQTFSPMCSAVLTDPRFGVKTLEYKDPECGLLLSIEESGYDGGKEVVPPLVENWGVEGIKGYGGAVKLILYFHPQEKNAEAKLELVKDIYQQTRFHSIPFLLEPILYPIEDEGTFQKNWATLQQQTVGMFDSYCDVHKIEFPGLYASTDDEKLRACFAIGEYVNKPWIVLSRGMEFTKFKHSLTIAMQGGARGFAVGRAVWQEIEQFSIEKTGSWEKSKEQIEHFLKTTGADRMKHLIEIVNEV